MLTSHETLVDRLAEQFDVNLGRSVEQASLDPRYPVNRVVADGVVIEIAGSDEGRRRLRLEAQGRRWARDRGIMTPEVLGSSPDGEWLVSRWVESPSEAGSEYVASVIVAAAALRSADRLPDGVEEASTWRAARSTVAVRALRTIAGGISPRLWLATKRQLSGFDHPMDVAHGDFYPRNVLGTPDGAMVVDWEYLGRHPRHTDLARMWSVLRVPEDRALLIDEALAGADRTERRRVGTLFLWHSLRLLGENLSAPSSRREPQNLLHARHLLPEACELARSLGAWPL